MIRCCHGFTDWSPRDMALFRKVEQLFLDTMESWSYNEIRTPTVEYLYLFTSAGTLTPGKLRRTYSFLDWDGWSGERVVLKPDATIPVARMYTENTSSRQTVRYSYVTNTFMFDDTGKKSRERWQCGAELIGTGASIADGELMSIILELMNRLNIPDFRLRLSHSGLISLLLKKAGLNTEESNQIFDELLDGNEQAFMRIEQANPELAHIFAMMLGMNGKTPGFLKNLKALLKKVISGDEAVIDDFIAVTEIAQAIGIPFEINLAAAKGYEYYTGIIFHVMSGSEVIGSGGRYDDLISLLDGPATPAAGFALYMDKLVRLYRQDQTGTVSRIILWPELGADQVCLTLASGLRKAGYCIEVSSGDISSAGTCPVIKVSSTKNLSMLGGQKGLDIIKFDGLRELVEYLSKEKRID